MTARRLALGRWLLLGVALLLAGCGPHRIRGLVRSGPAPTAKVVSADAKRLKGGGLEGAVVELTLDPDSLSPKEIGRAVTGPEGRFSLRVEEFGAEFLEYRLGVFARRDGHKTLWQTLPVPGRGERLLIVLTPGKGGDKPKRDIVEETLKMVK